MKEAKLTHGGFYGHFASKDALMAEAMAHALDRSTAWQERLGSLSELVAGYLSDRHRVDRANGCAMAALGAEVVRQSPALRRTVTAGVRQQIGRIVSLLKRGTPAARRRRALATYSGMVGRWLSTWRRRRRRRRSGVGEGNPARGSGDFRQGVE